MRPLWLHVLLRNSWCPVCAAVAQNGSAVDIVGSTFHSNKAGVTGGALRVQASVASVCALLPPATAAPARRPLQPATRLPAWRCLQGSLMCTACTFLENKAPLGGAVDLGQDSWAGFVSYSFQRNTGIRAGSERAAHAPVVIRLWAA